MYFCIFTIRNSSCGKVMFSQASVILSMGRGVSQHALGRGCVSQHALGGRHVADPPPLQQTVRILLECIPVYFCGCSCYCVDHDGNHIFR